MRNERIEFISEYCDRWCERCAFTSRCSSYAVRAAMGMCGEFEEAIELAVGAAATRLEQRPATWIPKNARGSTFQNPRRKNFGNSTRKRRRANGGSTRKVALISIDRSEAARQVIAQATGDVAAADLAAALAALRNEAEKRVPDARRFMRPGFDAVDGS